MQGWGLGLSEGRLGRGQQLLGVRGGALVPLLLRRAAADCPHAPCRATAVFLLEYYLDTLWKGMLLFVVCLLLLSSGLVNQV